ncbi:MAG TPA: GNAT family N-acetyltransferase [Rhizomicrobium sp.]|nr:GNAT family N-acetyltransferase [Rhizomicrobium sp.]
MTKISIRAADPGDEEAIHSLLYELAIYERLTANFQLTPAIIARDIIGSASPCCCAVAESDGYAVGIATWYPIYSTFGASHGLYLEDLFVRPARRGRGIGMLLLAFLAARAREEGAAYIDWSVLDWNKSAIAFYEKLGAKHVEGWHIFRLSGRRLEELPVR